MSDWWATSNVFNNPYPPASEYTTAKTSSYTVPTTPKPTPTTTAPTSQGTNVPTPQETATQREMGNYILNSKVGTGYFKGSPVITGWTAAAEAMKPVFAAMMYKYANQGQRAASQGAASAALGGDTGTNTGTSSSSIFSDIGHNLNTGLFGPQGIGGLFGSGS